MFVAYATGDDININIHAKTTLASMSPHGTSPLVLITVII